MVASRQSSGRGLEKPFHNLRRQHPLLQFVTPPAHAQLDPNQNAAFPQNAVGTKNAVGTQSAAVDTSLVSWAAQQPTSNSGKTRTPAATANAKGDEAKWERADDSQG